MAHLIVGRVMAGHALRHLPIYPRVVPLSNSGISRLPDSPCHGLPATPAHRHQAPTRFPVAREQTMRLGKLPTLRFHYP